MNIAGNEAYWMKVVADDRDILKQMIEMTELNPDLFDKRDLDLTKRFIQFMEMIFKYENLTLGSHKEIKKRLVRVHRNIPTKELDYFGYTFVVFNGLYIVSDVMFLSPDICKQYFSEANNTELIRSLDLPKEIIRSSIKYAIDSENNEMGVAILRTDPIFRYVNDEYPTKWSYPIF